MLDAPDFDSSSVKGWPLCKFIDWADTSLKDPSQIDALVLPPVQRSALWTWYQVTDLWDSILKGLPIGSFYLIERRDGDASFCKNHDTISEVKQARYELLDGQQRMRSMLLACGNPKEERRCLWIDLKASGYSLRLTTASQPFGYNQSDRSKLSFEKKRAARISFDKRFEWARNRKLYDHLIFDRSIDETGAPPEPAENDGNSYFLQFRSVYSAWLKHGRGLTPDHICDEFPHYLQTAFQRIVSAFEKTRAHIALIRVLPTDLFDVDNPDERLVLTLFDRIGRGGTPLSMEERLYSTFKFFEPRVHEAVETIRASEEIGRILSSAKIAATAIRIGSAISKTEDGSAKDLWRSIVPDPQAFATALRRNDNIFRSDILDIIHASTDYLVRRPSPVLQSFRLIVCTLLFDPVGNPNGLPKAMMADLPPGLWQVLAYWAYRHLNEQSSAVALGEGQRNEIIRFTMFWHLFCTNDEKASREAFNLINNNDYDGVYPGKQLYNILLENNVAWRILRPSEWPDPKEDVGVWRSPLERFPDEKTKPFFEVWWWSRAKSLPWLEREYIASEFADYDPTSDREDDRPFDFDHICARNTYFYITNTKDPELKGKLGTIKVWRDSLGSGIGNQWLVGSSTNRRWGDTPVSSKLGLKGEGMDSLLKASFEANSIEGWSTMPSHGGLWNVSLASLFQKLVERRALWLYGRFFTELGFESWIDCAP